MNPLRRLRTNLGLSQAAFGEAIGYSQAQVSAVECGAEPMGRNMFLAVMDAYREDVRRLRIAPEEFLRGGKAA